MSTPLVGIIMGSRSDWPVMQHTAEMLARLGVPVPATALQGQDALLSIVQMPGGIPVGTLAIGKPGAINAGLLAASILALSDPQLRDRVAALRAEQTDSVPETPEP